MKLKMEVNFDFGKLANKLPKIIDNQLDMMIISAERGSKENIDKGVTPKLKDSTIRKRKRKNITGTKPLYETGELYRSIKGSKDGLEIQRGGIWHHKGIERPQRPFIQVSNKDITPTFDKFKKERKEALHLSTPIKSR
jgi:hypothetical protein